jgi:hypothetical protein
MPKLGNLMRGDGRDIFGVVQSERRKENPLSFNNDHSFLPFCFVVFLIEFVYHHLVELSISYFLASILLSPRSHAQQVCRLLYRIVGMGHRNPSCVGCPCLVAQ